MVRERVRKSEILKNNNIFLTPLPVENEKERGIFLTPLPVPPKRTSTHSNKLPPIGLSEKETERVHRALYASLNTPN